MYSEYLGADYHGKIRKLLCTDATLCPDSIIDADLNIGAMKMLLNPALDKMRITGKKINTEAKYQKLEQTALCYLAGIICLALNSRTAVAPYNTVKYKKNWKKKRTKLISRGNRTMQELMFMG